MKNIIDAMKWRYAVSKFDTSKKLTDEQLSTLVDAMILAPSSFGLQPWKFIVVSNSEKKAALMAAGYGQAKINEASHLIVLAVEKVIDEKLVEKYMKNVSDVRGVPVENLKGYSDMINGAISRMNAEQRVEWAAKQAYIALGVLVAAGATEGIDVAPMEGFEAQKFDEILGLDKMGLTTKVIASVGFRAADDAHANDKKVRYPKEEVVIEVR
jgi:nitroreductase/dihydropteridine reductase